MNRRYAKYILAVFVSTLVFVVYLPALRNEFVLWDDDIFIIGNSHIRALDLEFLRWAFTDITTSGNWHPLTWISYATDYALWGLNPQGFHLTGILLHAVNTFVVVLLAERLVRSSLLPLCCTAQKADAAADESPSPDRSAGFIAGLVAGLFFGLHPLHVEPAVWAADRRDLLCTLFYMLSMVCYMNYVASRSSNAPQGKDRSIIPGRGYMWALFFMILAGASKPMAVTLPFIFLLLDWYPFNRARSFRDYGLLVLEKAPFLAISLALSVVAYLAQNTYRAVVPPSVLPIDVRVPVAFRSLVMYLWKTVVPLDLLPFYPYPKGVSFWSAEYLFMAAIACGLTAAVIVIAKRQKVFLAVWIWFIVTVTPVIGIVQIGSHSMADRYVYLPSLGLCMFAGTGAAWVWTKADSQGKWGRVVKAAGLVGMIFLVVGMSYMTVKQIAVWRNTIDLWSYVIEKEPEQVPISYSKRGLAYGAKGEHDRALADLTKAISLQPGDPGFYNSRGMEYGSAGQSDRAIKDFTSAIALDPGFAAAYSNRGLQFGEAGQPDRALDDFNTALRLDSRYGDAYLNRGLTYENMGQFDRAIEDYGRAVEIDPSDHMAWGYRGIVYGKKGEIGNAIKDLSQALSVKPDYVLAYLYRGDLYQRAGSLALAVKDFRRACSLGSEKGCSMVRRLTAGNADQDE